LGGLLDVYQEAIGHTPAGLMQRSHVLSDGDMWNLLSAHDSLGHQQALQVELWLCACPISDRLRSEFHLCANEEAVVERQGRHADRHSGVMAGVFAVELED
jgi:hypothetical protein